MATKQSILVLISGSGTNLQAIIDATQTNLLDATITAVISNRSTAKGLERAKTANIPTTTLIYNKEDQSREQYDAELIETLQSYEADLIVLAGWMHILSADTITELAPTPIINLHPALPNTFIGANAIKQTFESYQKDPSTTKAGLMVHQVVPEVDKGKPIVQQQVAIYPTDTEETLTNRIKYFEKPLLLQAITEVLHYIANPISPSSSTHSSTQSSTQPPLPTKTQPSTQSPTVYRGKARDYWDTNFNVLAMYQTQRQSAFDRHICNIPHKGLALTALANWWFKITRHIVPNHMLYSEGALSLVRKATPIPLEIVIRAYITGSTKTSLWHNYNTYYTQSPPPDTATPFTYCGHQFPSNLKKNQPLSKLYITPTTKSTEDVPISADEIISQNILTKDEWNYIAQKSIQLFRFGQKVSNDHGYILVDTKYEFGRDLQTGQIILIDELHTCDSSRYWRKDTYNALFAKSQEPEKLDKDMIRDYISSNTTDPYDQTIPLPIPPQDLIKRVDQTYINFANEFLPSPISISQSQSQSQSQPQEIITKYFSQQHSQLVIVLIDSSIVNDSIVANITETLTAYHLVSSIIQISAHKETTKLLNILQQLNQNQPHRQIALLTISNTPTLTSLASTNSIHPTYSLITTSNTPSSLPATPISYFHDIHSFAQQITKQFRKTSHLLQIS